MNQVKIEGGNGMEVAAPKPGTTNVVMVIYDVPQEEAEELLSGRLPGVLHKVGVRAKRSRISLSWIDANGGHRDWEPA